MRKPEQYVRRVGRTLFWLFQRAGLWLKWRPAAPASRAPLRSLHFESLEPRLLLSADLMPVGIHSDALNDPLYSQGVNDNEISGLAFDTAGNLLVASTHGVVYRVVLG